MPLIGSSRSGSNPIITSQILKVTSLLTQYAKNQKNKNLLPVLRLDIDHVNAENGQKILFSGLIDARSDQDTSGKGMQQSKVT